VLTVGLTGGIGCGKTTVGEMFVALGCRLIDSDQITHELFEPGQQVHEAVVREFGEVIVDDSGRIDRSRLAAIVFSEPSQREKLNSLVHPAIKDRQDAFVENVRWEDPDAIAIVDAALMVETGSYSRYDRLVVVACRPEQQRSRLKGRPGLTSKSIEVRIESQMPLLEKAGHADFVVDNSGSREETQRRVEEIYRELVRMLGS
jgi:dephospho-CoA kinase